MKPIAAWPGWVIFHVSHDSTWIPDELRDQFLLDDRALREEIVWMTDHFTHELFTSGVQEHQIAGAPASRLAIDVDEREDDDLEPLSRLSIADPKDRGIPSA